MCWKNILFQKYEALTFLKIDFIFLRVVLGSWQNCTGHRFPIYPVPTDTHSLSHFQHPHQGGTFYS